MKMDGRHLTGSWMSPVGRRRARGRAWRRSRWHGRRHRARRRGRGGCRHGRGRRTGDSKGLRESGIGLRLANRLLIASHTGVSPCRVGMWYLAHKLGGRFYSFILSNHSQDQMDHTHRALPPVRKHSGSGERWERILYNPVSLPPKY